MAYLSFLILTLRHWKNKVHINIPNCLLPGWNAWLNAAFSNYALLTLSQGNDTSQLHLQIPVDLGMSRKPSWVPAHLWSCSWSHPSYQLLSCGSAGSQEPSAPVLDTAKPCKTLHGTSGREVQGRARHTLHSSCQTPDQQCQQLPTATVQELWKNWNSKRNCRKELQHFQHKNTR